MPARKSFQYARPKTLDEAVTLLSDHGDGAKVLAGGTDLSIEIKDNLLNPAVLVDIKDIDSLRQLVFDGGKLVIGALTTFSDLIDSDMVQAHFPMIAEAAMTVASRGIRNRATVAGNICSAVPCMDSAPFLLVYEAIIHLQGPDGKRDISIRDFFRGPRKTACRPGEILTAISVPLPEKKHGGCYVKLQRTRGEDLAQSGVGILALADKKYRVAFTAVGPIPTRGTKIEALLEGETLTDGLLAEAKKLLAHEITPITDIRATKQYRLHVTEIMLERGLKAAVSRLNDQGPPVGAFLL